MFIAFNSRSLKLSKFCSLIKGRKRWLHLDWLLFENQSNPDSQSTIHRSLASEFKGFAQKFCEKTRQARAKNTSREETVTQEHGIVLPIDLRAVST
jgi:hypothetical protein